MSDTTTQECKCCATDGDCINGLCLNCRIYNEKLQKQVGLLTYGLLKEKEKNRTAPALLKALRMMTALTRLKYGNSEADIYAEIKKAEALITEVEKGNGE